MNCRALSTSLIFAALTILPAQNAKEESKDQKAKDAFVKTPLKVLPQDEINKIMSRRLEGSLGHSFGQFANMFLVRSRMDTDVSVMLKAANGDIADTELQAVFPEFYKPTLAELCDSIALQTFSKWSYEKDDQHVMSGVPGQKLIDEGIVVLSFNPDSGRKKPFTLTPASGWRHEDRGHWEMFIPPSAQVGMDIYEVGRYSAKKGEDEKKLMLRVRKEVSLEWAGKVHPKVGEKDLKLAKVGPFEALHFEASVPSRLGKDVHWRQWVFLAGDRCFFIVSTLFPEQEDTVWPDVQEMLKSFRCDEK
ncbi:MAG: hypothetical protein JNM65_05360 [Verrucomicrobiaceae bacterium]|nr:hypothetical protein [Verrucomicrobiaceae bacterium]